MKEVLLEVDQPQPIKEQTYQQYYVNVKQRDALISEGYYPVDPDATEGIALKTVRYLKV